MGFGQAQNSDFFSCLLLKLLVIFFCFFCGPLADTSVLQIDDVEQSGFNLKRRNGSPFIPHKLDKHKETELHLITEHEI